MQAAAEDEEIEYLEPKKPRWSSVGAVRDLPLPERLRELVSADDAAGELIWHTLAATMTYASKRIPEIADSIVDIDNAMKWGFAWEMGPFEIWDVLGVADTLNRMEGEGIGVAGWVQGDDRKRPHFVLLLRRHDAHGLQPGLHGYVPIEVSDKNITLAGIQRCCAPSPKTTRPVCTTWATA